MMYVGRTVKGRSGVRWSLVVVLLGVLAAPGANGLETEAQLAQIKLEVETHSERLGELDRQKGEREASLKKLRQELAALRREEKTLGERLEAVRLERDEVDHEIGRLGEEMIRLEELAGRRMRALYMFRTPALIDHVLGAENSSDLLRNAFFLGKVTAFDRALLTEMRGIVVAREAAREKLRLVTAEQEQVRGELTKRTGSLKIKLKEQERLVSAMAAEAAAVDELLTGLRAQALRLETVLVSLIEGHVETVPGRGRPVVAPAVSMEPFAGPGLEVLRGRLPTPVEGRLAVPFGRRQINRFEDYVLTKGQEFAAPVGSVVRVVAAGRVVHAGPMPGFGTIVVVDHGARSYSLYGRMVDIAVGRGQDVEAGGELGRTGELLNEGRGGNLYFEIRKGGAAVDPGPYLGRR
jgi:septal ring factor EnvC (AmiA/AmiB activator)